MAIQPGCVYALAGYVAFDNLDEKARCDLQVAWRDDQGGLLETVSLPYHSSGSRPFSFDYPHELCLRAPAQALQAEVSLCLTGSGRAWFDDVFFGPVPTGQIAGTVTVEGEPLADARVAIWGDPWGRRYEALTDMAGRYVLSDVPVAYPRYILFAAKPGYRSRVRGGVAISENRTCEVDFAITRGSDPGDLRVKFGSLEYVQPTKFAVIPEHAAIPADAGGYPPAVRGYLEADRSINPRLPAIAELAQEILDGLPARDRSDTRQVVWAVYKWLVENLDHDSVYGLTGVRETNLDIDRILDRPYRDVTSGIWQTLSHTGWCWGKNFYDWAYANDRVLEVRGAICVELAWLACAILRALNIPARAAVGSHEFWAQTDPDHGVWVHQSITGGRQNYRETGRLGAAFEGTPPELRFSVLSRPIVHEDWDAEHPGVWRETHPWGEAYEGTVAGYDRAVADLSQFAATGEAPRGRPPTPGQGFYLIHYSDVTINLFNMEEQRHLDVRFPMGSDGGNSTPTWHVVHWTNHPECVKQVRIEEVPNPPAKGAERWYHVTFDLASLLDG